MIGFCVIFSKQVCHLIFSFNNLSFHHFIRILFKPYKMGHIFSVGIIALGVYFFLGRHLSYQACLSL